MKKVMLIALFGALSLAGCHKDDTVTPGITKLTILKNAMYDVDKTISASSYSYGTINKVQLGAVTVSAENGPVMLEQLPITITAGAGFYYPGTLISNVYLYDLKGNQLDEESLTIETNNAALGSLTFRDIHFKVTDQPTALIIKADLVMPSYVYPNAFVQASITGQDRDAIIAYGGNVKLSNTSDTQQLFASYIGAQTLITN